MKLPLLLIFTVTLFYSCNNNNKRLSTANELAYHTDNITSGPLNVETDLTGGIKQQELSARIKLSNTRSKDLEVQAIAVSSTDGSNSQPTFVSTPFLLKQGSDTTLALKFNPFNNYKLYQVTGMHGNFKSAYDLKITHNVPGSDLLFITTQKSVADKDQYLAYLKRYTKQVTGYSFNTTNGFVEKQREYLKTLPQLPQPPFLFLSDQEITISGLNFRFKNYHQQDTLHADLFIINHSDFLVKINSDAFDINAEGQSSFKQAKTVSVEKVSGTRQNLSMIEKGDRVLIHFKKYMKINAPSTKHLQLQITRAFLIKGDKPLFKDDIDLLPNSF